ncbi:hypothetical protein FGB62_14g236 [Gracilaria domingensis]|nr:hypothetical protein FGB62_14g236 [Gracilaria domingensis]
MSWFSSVFPEQPRVSGFPSTVREGNLFKPSEESLRIFDELKSGNDSKLSSSDFQQSSSNRFQPSSALGKGEENEKLLAGASLLQKPYHRRQAKFLGCKRWFAGLELGNDRNKNLGISATPVDGGQRRTNFKPSEESLRVFDEAMREAKDKKKIGSRCFENAKRVKRFDPFQARRDGFWGETKRGSRLFEPISRPSVAPRPLHPEAIEWAKRVRRIQRSMRNEPRNVVGAYNTKDSPPQLQSHRPSVASGNVLAWRTDTLSVMALRREVQLKPVLEKKKGLFDSGRKGVLAVMRRFGALIQRVCNEIKEVAKSLKSWVSQIWGEPLTQTGTNSV